MTRFRLVRRSLVFHWRAHVGVVLGVMVGAAALTGALVVGDSVRASLRELALGRLGGIEYALDAGDRLVRAEAAQALQSALFRPVVPALLLPGMAASQDQRGRANRIQVLGVDERFWGLALAPPPWREVPRDAAFLNRALAAQLQITHTGEVVILRFKKPSMLAREATVATKSDAEVAWRVTVAGIVEDAHLGRFSLRANQTMAYNAWVNLKQLQELVQQTNRANLLLVGQAKAAGQDARNGEQLQEEWRKVWNIEDAQLRVRFLMDEPAVELLTDRVFLDPPVARAFMKQLPGGRPVLTYVANLLRAGERATPYSMVAALPSPPLPLSLAPHEIIINSWLAEDLGIGPGASLAMSYFEVDAGTVLIERTNVFTVRDVVPMDSPLCDRTLMPEFPGIADAESTSDWDAGFPLVHRIRPKDDQYWRQYRGTPKAFISLESGQKMWGNRYGEMTALRWPVTTGASAGQLMEAIGQTFKTYLKPEDLGLRFEPVRAQALAAAGGSQDFGGLFIGFSLFLIAAALILTALLFRFGVEQRMAEAGLLLAVGYPPRMMQRVFLGEALALAVVGSLVGMVGGVFYARAILIGLTTLWRDATGLNTLLLEATPASLAIGFAASVIAAIGSCWLVLRRLGRQPAVTLLAAQWGTALPQIKGWPWLSLVAVGLALGLVGLGVLGGRGAEPALFFLGGALLLGGMIGVVRWGLGWWLRRPAADKPVRMTQLLLRGCARRRNRSVATVSLLACGSFVVAAIGVFRLDALRQADHPRSGTGGFALVGESTLPVLRDLNLPEGRDFYGLSQEDLADAQIVPFRMREGDDASCLNLNRAQRPRVLGVRPEKLFGRFTFGQVAGKAPVDDAWRLLRRENARQYLPDLQPDEVPAIGDAASIQWALKAKVGGVMEYTDERGQTFKLRLVGGVAGSLLQGLLIIDEEEFRQRFPSESGHRFFLIHVQPRGGERDRRVREVAATLTRALQNTGFEATLAVERLAQFNAVQNTYLNTFQALGGLGLLLGTAGLAVVVLRNVLERRAELALLLAVGYPPGRLPRWVLGEHLALLLAGLTIGVLAALMAVAPALLSPGTGIPYLSLSGTLLAIGVSGMFWTWVAARLAVRGPLLAALRNE
ncbi:FtsX-like permease family protein [Fontisphaera persica]|uniref:FtsX-like permease family protein n=1 Tax=Fontisphaera persica TaxID=2974023 RepID=UPI0024BFC6F1|nr:FtsX-like permease family protein [Fontisphaera persica]WCJ60232.1 FtsX-like permease family protein [Fontisphaera persica]